MNEQATEHAYQLFIKDGYAKSREEFNNLIKSDEKAFDRAYQLFVRDGYAKSPEDFAELVGRDGEPSKKKDESSSPRTSPFLQQNLLPQQQPEFRVGVSALPSEGGLPDSLSSPTEQIEFDAEGAGYDDATAQTYGLKPDETGHWQSRIELPEEETHQLGLPEGSGLILKGRTHPTFDKTIKGEEEAGYAIYKKGDRYYSVPKERIREDGTFKPDSEKGSIAKEYMAQVESGTAGQVNAGIYGAIGHVYDLMGAGLRKLGIDVPYYDESLLTKDITIGGRDYNPLSVLDKLKKMSVERAKFLDEKVAQINPEIGRGAIEPLMEGDFKTGLRNLFSSVAQSVPSTVALLTTGGISTPVALTAGGIGFGAANQARSEADKEWEKGNISRDGLLAVNTISGSFEMLFERTFGSGAIGQAISKVITNTGEAAAKKEIKKSLKNTFVDMVIANPKLAPFGEAYEEIATQLSQNIVDKFSGRTPDKDMMEGVWDAGLAGLAMGGVFTGPTLLATKKAVAPTKEAENANTVVNDMANIFGDIGKISTLHHSDESIMKWADQMEKLGRIDEDAANRIKQNVGLRGSAMKLLNVGRTADSPALDAKTTTRLMDLLYAQQELSQDGVKTAMAETLGAVNAEIAYIAKNKTIPAAEQAQIDNIVAERHAPMPTYSIDGGQYTKANFLKAITKMQPADLLEADIEVGNDIQTGTIVTQRVNALKEGGQNAGQVREGTEEGGQQEPSQLVKGKEGRIRVWNTPQNGVETGTGEVVQEEVAPQEQISDETVQKIKADATTMEAIYTEVTERGNLQERRKKYKAQAEIMTRKIKSFVGGRGIVKTRDELRGKNTAESNVIADFLEAEMANIRAKQFDTRTEEGRAKAQEQYDLKEALIEKIYNQYKANGWDVGRQKSTMPNTKHTLFFQLPNTDIQLSYHGNFNNLTDLEALPKREWDNIAGATFHKLEEQAATELGVQIPPSNWRQGIDLGFEFKQRTSSELTPEEMAQVETAPQVSQIYNWIKAIPEEKRTANQKKVMLGIQAAMPAAPATTAEVSLKTQISIAPYFDKKVASIEEAHKLRTTEEYGLYRKTLNSIAEAMGLTAKIRETIGGYTFADGSTVVEISNIVNLEGATLDQAEQYAALVGALSPEVQEAVYANKYAEPNSEEHQIDELSLTVSNIEQAMQAMKAVGIDNFTLEEEGNTIILLDFSKGMDVEFTKKLDTFVSELNKRSVSYGNFNKRAVESREAAGDHRKEIIRNLSGASLQQGQGGPSLRQAVLQAIKRDAEFQKISPSEYLGHDFAEYEAEVAAIEEGLSQEVADLQSLLGVKEGTEGRFRLQTKEEQSQVAPVDVEAIEKQMNKMPPQQVNFTEPSLSRDMEVDPLHESNSSTKITDAEAKALGFENAAALLRNIEEFNGMPMLMSMTDTLATGTIKDSQGKPMHVGGGLLFNVLGLFKHMAWGSVGRGTAMRQLNAAKKLYAQNKKLFDALWAQGKIPKGLIPMAILRMANNGINSNEAVFRWVLPTVKKQSLENRTKAMDAFNESLVKKTELSPSSNKARVAIKDANSLQKFIKEKKIKTLDGLFTALIKDANTRASGEGIGTLPLSAKALVTDIVFAKEGATKNMGATSRALFGGETKSDDAQKFTFTQVYDAIGEPSVIRMKQGEVGAIVGINVLKPAVIKESHGNYGFGPKGQIIALIKNPKHGIDVFPEMKAKASRVSLTKAGVAQSTEKVARDVGGQYLDKAFIGSRPRAGRMSDMDVLIGKLRFAFPSVQVAQSQEEFNHIMRTQAVMTRQKNGLVIYGVTKDGKIYLNPAEVSLGTPIHEFGHIWIDYLRSEFSGEKGTALLARGMELVKGTKEHQRAVAKYGKTDLALEEALVELMATKGETIIAAAQKSKFKSWMNAVFQYIKSKFVSTKDLAMEKIKDMTLDDFINTGLADLFAGREVNSDFNPEAAVHALNARYDMEIRPLSMSEIITYGRAEGYSDEAIKEVLLVRGFKAREINAAMHVDVYPNTALPDTFANIDGGVVDGMKLYTETTMKVDEFILQHPNASMAEVRAKAIEVLEANPIYTHQTKIMQEAILVAYDRTLGTRAGVTTGQRISALKSNIRQRKVGATNLRNAQAVINQFIRENLPRMGAYAQADINRLVSIMNKTTEANFNAQAERILDIIANHREKVKKLEIKKIFNLIAKKAKPAMTASGKRRAGGISYDAHAFFSAAKPILEAILSGKIITVVDDVSGEKVQVDDSVYALQQIAERLNNNDEVTRILAKAGRNEELTTLEQRTLNEVIAYDMFAGIINADLEEVIEIYNTMVAIRHEGVLQLNANRLVRALEIEALQEQAAAQIKAQAPIFYKEDGTLKNKNELDQDRQRVYTLFAQLKIWEGIKQWAATVDFTSVDGMLNWVRQNLLHLGTLSTILDKAGTFFEDNIFRPLNRMNESYLKGYYEQEAKLNEIANSIEGITKGYKQIQNLIGHMGHVYVGKGGGLKHRMEGDQLARIYALSKNDLQRKKLIEQNGWSEAELEKIEDVLGWQVVEFIDKLVDYLSTDYYESVNRVYRKVNDVNLGWTSNYFPTKTLSKRLGEKILLEGNFNGIFNSETAPALKERIDRSSPIDEGYRFLDTLDDHINSMEKYKAYAEGVKKINGIFRSTDILTMLNETGMTRLYKYAINRAINDTEIQNTISSKAMTQFTSFALALKIVQIPKQFTSFVNAFEEYKFLKGHRTIVLDELMFMVDSARMFLMLPKEMMQAYKVSATFRERLDKGISGDISGLESGVRVFHPLSKRAGPVGKAVRFIKGALVAPTIIGDILGCMGYWVAYKRNIKNGMSQEEALEKFNDYNATAQTRRSTEKIPIQQSGGLERAFTMFGSTLFLQMNKTVGGMIHIMRALKKGKMPPLRDVRGVALNFAIANALFTLVSYLPKLLRGDDEDKELVWREIKDALMGLNLLEQIPLIGAAIEEVVAYARGERANVDDIVNPYRNVFRKMKKGFKEDDIIKGLRPLVEITFGVQFDPAIGLYKQFAGEGETEDNIYDILGVAKTYRPTNSGGSGSGGGVTKEDLRRYFPNLYESTYGKSSPNYSPQQMLLDMQREKTKQIREAKDRAFGYTPPVKSTKKIPEKNKAVTKGKKKMRE